MLVRQLPGHRGAGHHQHSPDVVTAAIPAHTVQVQHV